MWLNSKNQIVTNLKNSDGDKTKKLIVKKRRKKLIVTEYTKINSKCDNILKKKKYDNVNCDQTPNITKLKTQIVTKLKKNSLWQNSNCDKSQFDILTTNEMFSGHSFAIFAMFLLTKMVKIIAGGSVINWPTPLSFSKHYQLNKGWVQIKKGKLSTFCG